MSKLFYIEGNIGSGKSTLLEKLRERSDIEVIPEPVDAWCNITDGKGTNLLEAFYNKPERYTHLFQTVIVTTFLERHDTPQQKPIRICERSIETGKEVFVKASVNSGNMKQLEVNAYNKWYDYLSTKYERKPDGIIYLRTSPEKCYQRMLLRGRDEEHRVGMKYLEQIHDLHEQWLYIKKYDTPILVIDNDRDNNLEETMWLIDLFVDA